MILHGAPKPVGCRVTMHATTKPIGEPDAADQQTNNYRTDKLSDRSSSAKMKPIGRLALNEKWVPEEYMHSKCFKWKKDGYIESLSVPGCICLNDGARCNAELTVQGTIPCRHTLPRHMSFSKINFNPSKKADQGARGELRCKCKICCDV